MRAMKKNKKFNNPIDNAGKRAEDYFILDKSFRKPFQRKQNLRMAYNKTGKNNQQRPVF